MSTGDDFFYTGGGFSDWSGNSAGNFSSRSSSTGYADSPSAEGKEQNKEDVNYAKMPPMSTKEHIAATGCLLTTIAVIATIGYMVYCHWDNIARWFGRIID